jgi:zinc D-Ala-D-Ala carboxypeptidase
MNWADYPYFTKAEFDCKHSGKNEMQPEFMAKLQLLREKYGRPMIVTSGYRHWTHPVEARKGHTTGEHTRGTCADIACTSGAERYKIIQLALQLGFPRIGIAKNFIHLGIGGAGLPSPTIWDYS